MLQKSADNRSNALALCEINVNFKELSITNCYIVFALFLMLTLMLSNSFYFLLLLLLPMFLTV